MDMYKAHALEGASGVELTIALYDGIIRFMRDAIEAVERKEVEQRRWAVKRAMDIVIHLQATLNKDVGGKPAEALSDFYVAMFALMLQGSQANSRKKFEQVIANVRNVRDAWKRVTAEGGVNQSAPDQERGGRRSNIESDGAWMIRSETRSAGSWTA
jgi:flagellar secretion chaperone FliS